jgi:Flp pilus assembly CpaE family ATPase
VTFSVVTSVAVLDRTGAVQAAMGWVDAYVVDVDHPADLGHLPIDVDVLLVGARELTRTGLRRVSRWRRWHPASVVVAHVDGLLVDRERLRAAGVEHAIRGRLTTAKMRTALTRADAVLVDLFEATGRLSPAYDALTEETEEDESYDEEYDETYDEGYDAAYDEDEAALEDDLGEAAATPTAKLITVASATGGCGKTFFATTAASMLARQGLRVLVVDLDLQFGEVAAALRVQHPYSLYDGLYTTSGERLPASALGEHLDDLVFHHDLGFDVLTAPRDPVLADYVTTRDARVILDTVLTRYDIVVTDTPPSLNDVVITALDRSDLVFVLATLDVPSLRNMTAFLDVLGRLNMRDERLRLVMNKAQDDVGVTVEQANEAFNGRFRAVLPSDRAVSRAVNLGTTVTVHEPRAKVSRALVPIMSAMSADLGIGGDDETDAVPCDNEPQRPFGRRWRRLLPGGTS